MFLFAPVINHYLSKIDKRQRLYLLLTLGIISVYFGTVGGDDSLSFGQNIILFLFVYVIGNTLSVYQSKPLETIKPIVLFVAFLAMNTVILLLYMMMPSFTGLIMKLCFFYCSPLLILNSVLVFVGFSRINIQSKAINTVASSTYSMYIIHHIPIILYSVIGPLVIYYGIKDSVWQTIVLLTLFTLVIMLVSFIADQAFKPLFKVITNLIVKKSSSINDFIKHSNQ